MHEKPKAQNCTINELLRTLDQDPQDDVAINELYSTVLDLVLSQGHKYEHQIEPDDLASEVCLKVFRHLDKFSRNTNFKAWVATITRNHAINAWRTKERRQTDPLPEGAETGHVAAANIGSKLVGQLIDPVDKPIDPELLQVILGLGTKRSQIIAYTQQGFSYAEISEEMGIPVGTVMSSLSRARQKLKEDGRVIRMREYQRLLPSAIEG